MRVRKLQWQCCFHQDGKKTVFPSQEKKIEEMLQKKGVIKKERETDNVAYDIVKRAASDMWQLFRQVRLHNLFPYPRDRLVGYLQGKHLVAE